MKAGNPEYAGMSALRAMCTAAKELANDGILCDPSDTEVVMASAELAGVSDDLSDLSDIAFWAIVKAYDKAATPAPATRPSWIYEAKPAWLYA